MGTIKEGCLLNSCNTQCQKITISCPTPHTLSVIPRSLKELTWTRILLFMRYVNATDEHKGIKIDLTIFTMSCHSLNHLTRASRSACNRA